MRDIMGVDHRRLHAFMPQQLLDGTEVDACLQQVRRVGVAKDVRCHPLVDVELPYCDLYISA